jgi:hypothetical protein
MRPRPAVLALVLAAGLTGSAPARAQQEASEFPSSRVPGWSFTPGISFGGSFDSNVALANPPADTGRTQSDRLFTFQPFGQLEYFSPRTDFSTGYRGYARRYVEVRELDGFDQQAFLSFRRLATRRLTFFLSDTYLAAPTTDEVELNGVPFRRTGTRTNTASAGLEARLTKFTDLTTRYDFQWVDFDQGDTFDQPGRTGQPGDQPGTFDRPRSFLTGGWVNSWRTELRRRLSERVAVGGEYALRLADLNEGTRELLFQDAGGTVRFLLDAHTTLSAGAGVSYLDDRLFGDRRTGPYYRASLTHEADRATLGLSFQRMFVPSFGFGGSSDSQELRGFVRMPVNKNRMYVQASAGWRRSEPFISGELELDTFRVQTTFGYSATRWLRLEAFHAYTRQDSKVTGGEIDRQRAGGQIVISQPMRIR